MSAATKHAAIRAYFASRWTSLGDGTTVVYENLDYTPVTDTAYIAFGIRPAWVDCVAVEDPWECCDGGGATSGCTPANVASVNAVEHVLMNNTFYSEDWRNTSAGGGIYLDIETDIGSTWIVKNNLFIGEGVRLRGVNIDSVYDFDSDYNIWDFSGDTDFTWYGSTYDTLPLFSANSGSDANSKGDGQNSCSPTFVNLPIDMHLTTGDTCAQEEGTSVSGYLTDDYDFDARPQSTFWDVGADEYASGYTPEGACCTGGVCSITTEAACSGGIWQGSGTDCDPDPCASPGGLAGFAEGVGLSGAEPKQ